MRILGRQIRLSASDLSNHLACRHLTTLELQVARGERTAPDWADPDLKVIQELGLRHEKAYLAHLLAQGLKVENLGHIDHKEEARLLAETLALMERGAQVIAQGALSDGEWFGRPDVLRRVENASAKWAWSYEVADTKLARETKATTILQLSLYSDLLAKIQGTVPEFLWVVPPGEGFAEEKYRVSEYAAYSRFVMKRLRGPWARVWVKRRIQSRWSTATFAGGSRSATRGGGRMIICRWWRESGGNSGTNLKRGRRRRWQSLRYYQFRLRRGRSTDPNRD